MLNHSGLLTIIDFKKKIRVTRSILWRPYLNFLKKRFGCKNIIGFGY